MGFVDPSGLLTTGAEIYVDYYSGKKFDAQERKYDLNDSDLEDWEVEELSYRSDDDINLADANIDKICELDEQGLVSGRLLDVPVYNQLNTPPNDYTNNLCWATCAAMVASYQLGDNIDRTLYIAKMIMGSSDVSEYNQPWSWASTNDPSLELGIELGQEQDKITLSMGQIKNIINNGKPFGVLYRNDFSGHWIVAVGYASAPGYNSLVVSNDPWGGIQRAQTYENFSTLSDKRKWEFTAK